MIFIVVIFALLSPSVRGSDCECGLENLSTRVFHGNETLPNRYPWLVSIKSRNRPYLSLSVSSCGGVLIDDRHVITAAHCLLSSDNIERLPEDIIVLLGAHNIRDRKFTKIRVKSLRFDRNYLHTAKGTDIAVIELVEKVTFSRNIHPICVWNKRVSEGTKLTVAGWGRINADERGDEMVPREAEIEAISTARCNKLKRSFYKEAGLGKFTRDLEETNDDICAFNFETKSDSCKGDSGGPLMWKNPANGLWYLVGVVSRGWVSCGKSDNVPGIYTAIYPHLDSFLKTGCYPQ